MQRYTALMANEEPGQNSGRPTVEPPPVEESGASVWSSAYGAVRKRPVTTLTVAAAIGAMAGAELLAAGLIGGAAALLLQRRGLSPRVSRVVQRTQHRLHDLFDRAAREARSPDESAPSGPTQGSGVNP